MNPSDWHQRFKQQAGWSKSARQFCLSKINFPAHPKILEIGSGTGAVLSEFLSFAEPYGVDLNLESLSFAKNSCSDLHLNQSDGANLPFPANHFDLTFCHYLLLWLPSPREILKEMFRVTKPGGWIACFAEPDYLARIDHPQPLQQLGELQNLSLQHQGARLDSGRQLTEWLSALNLGNLQSGILGAHWAEDNNDNEWQLEWDMIKHDLINTLTPHRFNELQTIDRQAHKTGSRILFIPTFYAWGQKISVKDKF